MERTKPDRMSQSVKQQVRQAQTGEQLSQTKQPCEKPQSDGQRAKRAQQKKIIIISAVVCAVAIVILIAAITRNVSRSHDNSFDYREAGKGSLFGGKYKFRGFLL